MGDQIEVGRISSLHDRTLASCGRLNSEADVIVAEDAVRVRQPDGCCISTGRFESQSAAPT